MEYLKTDDIRQFSYGFMLVLPFKIVRHTETAAINEAGDKWEVRIVKPDGTLLVKTEGLEFPSDTIQEIAVPLDALDLDRAGIYYYQVAKTTEGVVRSAPSSFTVNPGLPIGLPVAAASSPLAVHFPVFDVQGALASSQLKIDENNLKWNGMQINPAYKVWRGLLSQTGTAAPTAVVVENSLGGNIVWTRISAGFYKGTLANAFPAAKTIDSYKLLNQSGANMRVGRDDNNSVIIFTKAALGGANADGQLFGQMVEIYVVP